MYTPFTMMFCIRIGESIYDMEERLFAFWKTTSRETLWTTSDGYWTGLRNSVHLPKEVMAIFNRTYEITLWCNLNQRTKRFVPFVPENIFENVICKISAIVLTRECVTIISLLIWKDHALVLNVCLAYLRYYICSNLRLLFPSLWGTCEASISTGDWSE